MEVIKARYSGCNEGKEVIRVQFDRQVGEDKVETQTGILVKATEKSLVVIIDEYTKVVFTRKTGKIFIPVILTRNKPGTITCIPGKIS